ncbi:MAG TPA: hypothetical protein VK966_04455 [Longimicrobiales bacterium]|nr:hypothetical protein [Longimicrobiales bacterium]
MNWIFLVAAVLVAGAGITYRLRMARRNGLTDDAIRAIERHGRVEHEPPLDVEAAAEEEERFWNETWDEPEPL